MEAIDKVVYIAKLSNLRPIIEEGQGVDIGV